jgi:putative ABC transport system permease protein
MSIIRAAWSRVRSHCRGAALDRDMDDELASHLEMATDDLEQQGLPRAEARRIAQVRLGGVETTRQLHREARGLPALENLAQDVRHALRTLRRSPGFTVTAVSMLAVGLGLNAAVFTVTSAVLFRGFRGVEANDRIVYIGTQKDGRGCCVSWPDFQDWRTHTQAFEGLGAVADARVALSDASGLVERASATRISANAFALLGLHPMLGRDFSAEDAHAGAAPVTILSHDLWERRYGRNPAIVGEVVRIDGTPTTVIAVMPKGVAFPQNQDLWVPLVPTADLARREARSLWFAFGRLAPGVSVEHARAELATIGRRLALAYPATNDRWMPEPRTFAEFFVDRRASTTFGTLWAGVGFVLLIACANLANLILARAIDRAREVALRLAMGAPRWRIARQFMIESAAIALLGAAGGWWLARVAVTAYTATANPPALAWSAGLLNYEMDLRVFAYLSALTLGTAVVFGIVPALRLSRVDVHTTLKDGGGRTSAGARGRRLSALLMIAEVALAVVLLTAAGAMGRTFARMFTADTGVDTSHIATMLLNLPERAYASPAARMAFFERLTARLVTTAGVASVSTASAVPTAGVPARPYMSGDRPDAPRERPTVPVLVVGPDYFRSLGAHLSSGREFATTDRDDAPVAIVNRRFADTEWPGEDAIGKRLRVFDGDTPGAWMTVVGIAPNIAQNDVSRTQHAREPVVYVPFRQQPVGATWVLVRTSVPPITMLSAIREAVRQVDASLPVWLGPFTLDTWMASLGTYWRTGSNAALFTSFAAVALLLASIGLYALVSHAVGRRRHEIAIRMAVGGCPADIVKLIYSDGMRQVACGLALGMIGAVAFVRLLGSAVANLSSADPISYIAAGAVLVVAASLACLIPARRAVRADPVAALRDA